MTEVDMSVEMNKLQTPITELKNMVGEMKNSLGDLTSRIAAAEEIIS